jgi:hypothetical protein
LAWFALVTASALLAIPLASATAAPTSYFTSAGLGDMTVPRFVAAAAPLPDGRVLIAGGASDNETFLDSAEVFDPATGTFSGAGIGRMSLPRWAPAAAPLPDGGILIAGGAADADSVTSSAEVFDPRTRQFSTGVGAMTTPRYGAAAAPLQDGRILIAGGNSEINGFPLSSAEVFDPATGDFSSIGTMTVARSFAAAAPLPDGRILIAGGGLNDSTSAEVFDPETNQFSSAGIGGMGTGREGLVAVPLADGRVLVAGGDVSGPGGTAEVFDPASASFSSERIAGTAGLRIAPVAAPLPDGRVLLAGGRDSAPNTLASAETFVPAPSPSSSGLDFGDETAQRSAGVRSLRVVNLGTQTLRPAHVAAGGPAAIDYAVVRDRCSGQRLQFRDDCEVDIKFTPSATGNRPASLLFSSNATDQPVAFSLSGRGVAPAVGPPGPPGEDGKDGRDAKVTCTVKKSRKRKRSKVKVTCKVIYPHARTDRRLRYALYRGGQAVRRGHVRVRRGRARIALGDLADLPRGSYRLRVGGKHGVRTSIRIR